jgi:CRP-like cAMP-binding protein
VNEFIQHFKQYIQVSESLETELRSRTEKRVFQKGEVVHNSNAICTETYFIQKGLLRLYFSRNDKEISEYFCSEGEWINSPRSFMFSQLDCYSIDAIENAETYSINVENLGYLFDNFPEMERYARLSMGSMLYQIIERIASLRFHTALEKYDHFRMTYKNIHPRIPLGMVASYLGITQETLSRIRVKP